MVTFPCTLPHMKLSAKFARQETEDARLARVARRRVPRDRVEAIARMLSLAETLPEPKESHVQTDWPRVLLCPECSRAFALPMHLGRHRKTKHDRTNAA